MTYRVLVGDVRDRLRDLEDGSVQTCITSPPYWGLRDYGTATWDGGDAGCDHKAPSRFDYALNAALGPNGVQDQASNAASAQGTTYRDTCGKCGATRIDSQLGLEPTPEAYVENMVAVFRDVRRVLRDDGTVWLNLGDSYAGPRSGETASRDLPGQWGKRTESANKQLRRTETVQGLKPKDLVGIPWRVAFALQADGWYLRSDIIWSKPNPMPESVTDRPTKAHEYLFLLTKSARYYFDADAVREPHLSSLGGRTPRDIGIEGHSSPALSGRGGQYAEAGRNIRTVWSIATEPFPGAHFATFPKKLVEPCVKAGTSEKGCCPECGAPWVRLVERTAMVIDRSERTHPLGHTRASGTMLEPATAKTSGWEPTCQHTTEPVPCTVLDPFCGSGTTGLVALRHGRDFVGIELNPTYAEMARERIRNDAPLFNEEAV